MEELSPDWHQSEKLGISHGTKAQTDLSLGDTDITPPETFRNPQNILDEQRASHKYSLVAGREKTRKEIVDKWLQSDYFAEPIPVGQTPTGEPSIIVTPGGQAAMHHAINTALDTNETALLIEPYYPYHTKSVRIFDQNNRITSIATTPDTQFQPPISAVREAVENNAVGAIVLCSPANPTGTAYNHEWLANVADIARTHDLNVISDEVYAFLTYEGTQHRSIATYPEMAERTFVVGSFSKVLGLSGWRLGFIRAPTDYFELLVDVTDSIAMQASTAGQVLLEHALCEDDALANIEPVVDRLQSRMEILLEPFRESHKISVQEPDGGFYLLPTVVSEYQHPVTELSGYEQAQAKLPTECSVTAGDCLYEHLLETADVEGTRGRLFGSAAKSAVRLAYGQTPAKDLSSAADRIQDALASF